MTKEEKQKELEKYRTLNLATLDYYIESSMLKIKTEDFDSDQHYKSLKPLVEENFEKGRLTRLKQWFRDLIEMMVENEDFEFNKFIKNRTGYDIDIHSKLKKRIERIIKREKIKTEDEYRDILNMVDNLCQQPTLEKPKLDLLNSMLLDFDNRIRTKK